MSNECSRCGRTKSQIAADAKTLGLLEEWQTGTNTCCEISQWADEQWLAWVEATEEHAKPLSDLNVRPEHIETDLPLVPIRLIRAQVPWYKNPDHLG